MTRPDHALTTGTGREPIEQFLKRIRPRLKRVLQRYDVPAEDAEDLLQQSLLDALRKWETIENLETWLIGTLGYKCVNYWKKRRGGLVHAVDMPVLEQLSQPQAPPQELGDELADLRRLMAGLGRRHRAALWLRFGLGLSPGEVARRLGYSTASIRKLTARSMARLRRWADSGPDEDDDSCPPGPGSKPA